MSVAIYCRESTERQEIETLVSLCVKEAEKLGYKEYKIYKDVESGYSNTRSEYLKMLEDIKADKIKILILYESSRLTRDELEHQIVYRLFREKGVKVYTVNHGWLDLNNEDDIFLTSLLNLLDAREGRKSAKRTKDRMKELAENGRWTGGPAPLGYKLVNKELIVDEENARIVKEIFRLFLEGHTRSYISKLYGFETKKVIRMLKNPVYIGKLKFHAVEVINKKRIEHKEYTLLQGIHEPIIDEITFNLVQSKLSKIKREISKDIYIFKDLLYCPCGNKLYFVKHGSKYKGKYYNLSAYSCSFLSDICLKSQIKEENILSEVLNKLEEIISSFDFCENTKDTSELEKDIKHYKKLKEQCSKKVEILLRNLLNGLISQEIFEKMIKENEQNETLYNDKIIALERRIKQTTEKETNSKIIREYFEKIKTESEPQKLNTFLKIIIDKIEFVNEFRIYLHLRL